VVRQLKTILSLRQPSASGPLVLSLQRALRKRGIHHGPPDGVYGPMTMAAVKAFQFLKGLVVDGEAAPAVAKALGIAWR
jgi:peptidoglycan hydrolase-like protein with peptidoglycan-binding domain